MSNIHLRVVNNENFQEFSLDCKCSKLLYWVILVY